MSQELKCIFISSKESTRNLLKYGLISIVLHSIIYFTCACASFALYFKLYQYKKRRRKNDIRKVILFTSNNKRNILCKHKKWEKALYEQYI